MGCSSSKSTEIHQHLAGATPINAHKVSKRVGSSTGHGIRKKSTDSGISLSECNERKDPPQFKKSAIAFEIPMGYTSNSNTKPARFIVSSKFTGDVRVRTTSNEGSVVKSDALNHIDSKQARAGKLREQELHSIVARQRRREARARQVQERRTKLQNELEMMDDEDLSDIEVDGNFHVNDDYDFAAEDSSQQKDVGNADTPSVDSDAF